AYMPRPILTPRSENAAPAASPPLAAVDSAPAALPRLLQPSQTFRLIGQAGESYLILEGAEGIYILDQHALHERWLYEELGKAETAAASQRLLLPAVLELTPAEAEIAEAALPFLRAMGFAVEIFGVFTLAISAAPAAVPPQAVAAIVREALADVETGATALEPLRERLRRALACRSAVKFGQTLAAPQLLALAERFVKGEQPAACPHGRPVAFILRWEELRRRFSR
ncbi:MAG: hypothetical protein N3A66_05745, partial [Planctomycetota bacterium]|nr:hypothetical protein [Planctomycetota bacterium]